MIISTRESKKCRERVLELGVSQISGGSKTTVGGYACEKAETEEDTAQFEIEDRRTLDEILKWLMELGYVPSFCTACYREGRVGDRFMEICKDQQIHNFCHPNAIMTLKEYLEDYASAETKQVGEELIQKELHTLSNKRIESVVEQNLKKIEQGERDFRF
jgi:2-iminoacetate synthase